DSEGIEGRFFTWPWDELTGLVGFDAAAALGATPEGNWPEGKGRNVLWFPRGELPSGIDLSAARAVLFGEREGRVRPATDDKVLCGWNAIAIQALAEAGRAFGNAVYLNAATAGAEFVLGHLRNERGRLLRSWRDGTAGRPAFCDDHALWASACLTLFAATEELRWYAEASRSADELVALFSDEERGGFFQTGSDDDPLVIRPKDLYDNAVPSGNSAAADVLQRVSLLTGDAGKERTGVSAIRLVQGVLGHAPTGFGHALCALDLYLGPSNEVAIVGEAGHPATDALVDEVVGARFLPNTVVAVADPRDDQAIAAVPLLRDRPQIDGLPTAYVCRRFACRLPVTRPEDLAAQLQA
ncbi:MAG: thioredoxin domain-containing protein, partial [Gemmatimonadota bacterium]